MNKTINMGLDVGNFDTKTQYTSTCSGFNEFSKRPYGTTEALIINQAMRRYVNDEEVNEENRKAMEQMLDVEPIFVDVAERR